MRKNFKSVAIVATLLIAAAGVVLFEACNKKNEAVNNMYNHNIVSNSTNTDMDNYLIDLRERMKSATKDGENISIAEAEWNLTALENFSFCNASMRSLNMIVDTFYTKIKVDNNSISLYDLNIAYENNKKQIVDRFNSLNGDDKNIYFIQCFIDNGFKNDSVNVKTVTQMRDGGLMPDQTRFGTTDYWYDFDGQGKCDIYAGQCIGSDATIQMNSKVITNMPIYLCPNGRVYFTDIEYHQLCSLDYYCNDSPYPPFSLYVNIEPYYNCLTPNELNWYLDKMFEIIHNEEDNLNKYMVSFHMFQAGYTGPIRKNAEFWLMDICFGTMHCTNDLGDI